MGDEVTTGGDDDPFAGLELDESFVSGAKRREASADERLARLRRIDDEHRRLARDKQDERHRLAKQLRNERRRRPGRLRPLVGLIAILGLAFYLSVVRGGSRATLTDSGSLSGVVNAGDRPKPSAEEQDAPIGAPAPVPDGVGSYSFIRTQAASSKPVAYDPCRPIHVVINDRTVITDGDQILRESFDRASAATGFRFVIEGATDEAPRDDRNAYQPDRYPDRWAPVLVSWSDSTETPRLAGRVAGEGGSTSLALPGHDGVFVTGEIDLDGPDMAGIVTRRDGRAQVRAIILHEIGHLLGLAHVTDATQLMNAENEGGVLDYAVGDLQGLALLGRGACVRDV